MASGTAWRRQCAAWLGLQRAAQAWGKARASGVAAAAAAEASSSGCRAVAWGAPPPTRF